jgi:tetratricopeptide (TPR) repeat protein
MKKAFYSYAFAMLSPVALLAQTNAAAAVATKSVAITEYRQGLSLYKQGQYADALTHAAASMKTGGTAEGHYLTALCHKKMGKDADAAKSFESALHINPNHVDALSQLGIIQYNTANYKDAAVNLSRAAALLPSDAQLAQYAEKAKAKIGTNVSTLAKVTKAAAASVAAAPATVATTNTTAATAGKTSSAHISSYNEGLQMLKESDYYGAITAFQKALKEAPAHAATNYNLGLAYREVKGEMGNALKYIQKASTLDTKNSKFHHALGAIYYEMGEGQKAQGAFEQAYLMGMKTKSLYKSLASTYMFNEQYDKAILLYETAIKEEPEDAQLHFNLATAYLNGKKVNASIAQFDKVLAINPGYKDAYYNKGCALIQMERYDEAIKTGEAAIKVDKDYAKAYLLLASAYSKKNDSYHQDKYEKMAKRLDPNILKGL